MKVVDISDELFRELGEPTTLSIPAISFWLKTNIGCLNSKIHAAYAIDDTTDEITPELGEDEKYIFKKMYLVHYYDVQIRTTLGAASTDSIVEISTDGTSVRKVSKTEQGKYYQSAKNGEVRELDKLVHDYKSGKSSPVQVAGDDTVAETSAVPTDRSDHDLLS